MTTITLNKKLIFKHTYSPIKVYRYLNFHGFMLFNKNFNNRLFMLDKGIIHVIGFRFSITHES